MAPITTASNEETHAALLDTLDLQKLPKPFRNPAWKPAQRRNKNLKQVLGEAQRAQQSLITTQQNSGATTPVVATDGAGTPADGILSAEERDLSRLVLEKNATAASSSKPTLAVPGSSAVQPSVTYTSIQAAPSLKPKRKYCDITGLPAKYTDPTTRLNYHNAEIYRYIRGLGTQQVQEYLAQRGANTVLKSCAFRLREGGDGACDSLFVSDGENDSSLFESNYMHDYAVRTSDEPGEKRKRADSVVRQSTPVKRGRKKETADKKTASPPKPNFTFVEVESSSEYSVFDRFSVLDPQSCSDEEDDEDESEAVEDEDEVPPAPTRSPRRSQTLAGTRAEAKEQKRAEAILKATKAHAALVEDEREGSAREAEQLPAFQPRYRRWKAVQAVECRRGGGGGDGSREVGSGGGGREVAGVA